MSDKIKAALLGYGKMGRMIESIAPQRSVEIKAHYDEFCPLEYNDGNRALLQDVEILIDFSTPETVLDNINKAAAFSKNLVIGTTGWYDQIDEVRGIVEKNNIGLIYGSNFSLGVNLFFKIVDYAAKLFSSFDNYDPFIEEAHHKMKKDAPSGTALIIKKLMDKSYRDRDVLINSIRAGYIPGSHAVNFDSAVDSIRLEHVARNRNGFAEGALLAAKWIKGKTGFYEFQDVLDDILEKEKGI